jgi:hypothetical protein
MPNGQFLEYHIMFHFLFSMNKTCYCELFPCPLSLSLSLSLSLIIGKQLQSCERVAVQSSSHMCDH